MSQKSKAIVDKQMKILFRGDDSSVLNRKITYEDMCKLHYLNIEYIKSYLPTLDSVEKNRALNTLRILKEQLDGTCNAKQLH